MMTYATTRLNKTGKKLTFEKTITDTFEGNLNSESGLESHVPESIASSHVISRIGLKKEKLKSHIRP